MYVYIYIYSSFSLVAVRGDCPAHNFFRVDFLVENWSKIANIGRIWTKLGRNPIELDVPEPLAGTPEPDSDQNGPKNQKYKKKSCVRGSPYIFFIY